MPVRIPAIASAQCGVFSRRQARDAGLTRKNIRRQLCLGVWSQLLSDTFVLTATPRTAAVMAWAAHLTTRGVVSHESAAFLHGLTDAAPSAPHVISPVRRHVDVDGVIEHRVRLDADEVESVDGLPITNRTRTLLDLMATRSREDSRRLLFRAVQQNWLDEGALRDAITRRRNMSGTKQLRELADSLGTGAHSVAELALHRILGDIAGLRWAANVPVSTPHGRFVVDVMIADHAVVVEVDGRRFHSAPEQFTRDRRRQNALVSAGMTVLRFTWIDLMERPSYVRRSVGEAISVSSGPKRDRTEP